MKTETKTASVGPDTAQHGVEPSGFEPRPGGTPAPTVTPERSPLANRPPMAIPFLGFEPMHRRLVANGFHLPKIAFPDRLVTDTFLGRFSFQLTTPQDPAFIARQWIRGFMSRSISAGGVEAIKQRIKINVNPLWRWLQKTV